VKGEGKGKGRRGIISFSRILPYREEVLGHVVGEGRRRELSFFLLLRLRLQMFPRVMRIA